MAKFQRALDSIACENQKPAMVKGSLKGERLPGGEQGPMVMLSVSVSAQELRSLDKEEEGSECSSNSSSPREAMEDCMRSLESETNSPKASTSYSSNQSQNGRSPWRGFFRLLKQRSMRRLSTIPPVPLPRLTKRNKSSRENSTSSKQIPVIDPESLCFKPSWKNFTLTELEKATNYFSSENMIGTGGYAEVYKGQLQDGQLVAVKRLTRESTEETTNDFLIELGIMVHINHPNAAKLIGFGVEGGMHLVLQLSLHGSLACLLSGSKEELNWGVRHRIAIGTAEGLHYLHEGGQRRIIHRDIKASNILLTDDFEPQICDYGLAKWLPDQWTHHNVSKFEGTFGYLAPEYLLHGIVDEKTDVFAFGVLLLELITGRPAIDSSQKSLVMWAKPLLEKNDIKQLVDPSLGDAYNRDEMNHVTLAVSKCIEHSSLLRPRMSQVIQILKGEGKLKSLKSSHTFALHRTYSEELLDADEYNSTRYLHDLRRHRQVALESCNS